MGRSHKRKPNQKTVKCGWCGRIVALSNKLLAMPHRNGAQMCPGGGQSRDTHAFLQQSHEEARALEKRPR